MCQLKDLGELPDLPIIPKNPKQRLTVSLAELMEQTDQYKIDGKMKVVEEVWDKFIKILHEHRVDIPKFPIWTDWWDKEDEGTFIRNIRIGLIRIVFL